MKDALWRRLLAGLVCLIFIVSGVSFGGLLGVGLAESFISGANGFVTVFEDGRPAPSEVQLGHKIGLVLGMSTFGAISLYGIFVPLIRRTGLVSEQTLQLMMSQRRRS